MLFQFPLKSAQLCKRYKRFLANVITQENQELTLHCANTGAMTGCAEPGDTVWYSLSDNPKRKYPASWELTQTRDGHFICINTGRAVSIVKEALETNCITELGGYDKIRSEVRYGEENSRIDLLLESSQKPYCYIEVKSVTLYDPIQQKGYFPDAVTLRGQKHLRELTRLRRSGLRAVIFFLIQHTAIDIFSPAGHIDKAYAEFFHQAIEAGVEVLCYKTALSPSGIEVEKRIPFQY